MPISTMQDDYPLTMTPLFEHGRQVHANSKVITFTGDGYVESTFAEVADRADRLAAALTELGVQPGRPGRHVHVEQPDAPRGVPGDPVHGCGAAHAEHPAVPRAAGLRHQPRRGQGHHRRRVDRAAAGQGARSVDDGRAHHREGHRRHVGPRRRPLDYDTLLDAAPSRVRVPRAGREVGHGHVLHERHHRQPQGRHVQPSQHVHALDDGHVHRQHRAQRAATGCWSSCRCSTPTRGAFRTRRG